MSRLNAKIKSTSGERTPDNGIMSLGKYTFVMICAFVTILVVDLVIPSAKRVHGMSAARTNSG